MKAIHGYSLSLALACVVVVGCAPETSTTTSQQSQPTQVVDPTSQGKLVVAATCLATKSEQAAQFMEELWIEKKVNSFEFRSGFLLEILVGTEGLATTKSYLLAMQDKGRFKGIGLHEKRGEVQGSQERK